MLARNTVFAASVIITVKGEDKPCLVNPVHGPFDQFTFEIYVPRGLRVCDSKSDKWVSGLWLHCAVNNNDGTEKWYGFPAEDQREFFLALMQADGVGPGSAYKVLDSNTWTSISEALEDQDAFRKLKGVGPKTADKLIPILFKDKPKAPAKKLLTDEQKQRIEDATATLVALGQKKVSANILVTEVLAQNPGYTTEQLVKAALKR